MAEPKGGYIKIFRKAYENHPFWLEKRKFSRWEAWEWLIQLAPWGDNYVASYQGHSEGVPRGHVLVSVRHCAKEWGWSKTKVARFMDELKTSTAIRTVKETPVGTLYLIVNYEVYQGYETQDGTATETLSGTATGQQRDKNNTNNTTSPAGRFCAAVNQGLQQHEDPRKRQLIPRITPHLQSTLEAVASISEAGVPEDFAERELFEAGRTHRSETHVTSLKYFAPRIIRLWREAQAGKDAVAAKIPVKSRQADAQRIWSGIKRTNLLFAHNADEWLAAVTQMQVADEVESVEWFRSLWKAIDKNTLLTARSDNFAAQHIAQVMPANLRIA